MIDAIKLYKALGKTQEKQGYFFNKNKQRTIELLEGLLTNKQRYGYMVCPCRLASGDFESDRDIICPCEYREADVKEYGSCYCTLYVSMELKDDDQIHPATVPERRPPDKMIY